MLASGIRSSTDVAPRLQAQLSAEPQQYAIAGKALAERQNLSAKELANISPLQFEQMGRQYVQSNGNALYLSLGTNPVELSGLITALAGTFFIIIFAFRTDKLIERLPSLQSLDDLMYKTACLAFAGLAMLLITGAIWANESWAGLGDLIPKNRGSRRMVDYAAFCTRGSPVLDRPQFGIFRYTRILARNIYLSRRHYLLPGLHSYA